MKGIARKYLEFMRQPDVAALLVVALVARMPVGMVGFSMVMFLREALGDFARAGSAVGVSFVAMAVAAPIQGRLVDLHGPRHLLRVTGFVQPVALAGVLASAKLGWGYPVVAAFAALAGAFASPITTLTRTVWRNRFEREEERRIAFALDAITIELNFTLGPAIVAAALALAGPTAAFALAICLVIVAVIAYTSSRALAFFRQVQSEERHLLGPLTEPRLWIVFVATFGVAMSIGMLEVGYPAFATWIAMPAFAGLLLALNSLGSALGGAVYGGLHFRAPLERQYAVILGLMAMPVFLHAVLLAPVALGVVAFVAGVLIAPSITAQAVLVSRLAPARYATEAFMWSSTFIVSGLGAGMALGGALVETAGLAEAFGTGGLVVAAAAVLALGLRGSKPDRA